MSQLFCDVLRLVYGKPTDPAPTDPDFERLREKVYGPAGVETAATFKSAPAEN